MLFKLSFSLFFLSLCLIFVQKRHFLSVLLVLEMMTLSIFMMVLSAVGFGVGPVVVGFSLVFLVFGVYEAANGLGLLVSRSRSVGVDQLGGLFSLMF